MCDPITGTILAIAAIAGSTAIAANQLENVGSAQKSAGEEAASKQAQTFAQQQAAFSTLFAQAPTVETPAALKDQAKQEALKKRALLTKTVLTSPLGILNEPAPFTKTLLGQ